MKKRLHWFSGWAPWLVVAVGFTALSWYIYLHSGPAWMPI